MQLSHLLVLPMLGLASAKCNANNCARAVTGTRRGAGHPASASIDCSSFFGLATASGAPGVAATTVTVTTTLAQTTTVGPVKKRQGGIPAYASPCSDVAAYSSACSCLGVYGYPNATGTATTTTTVYRNTTITLSSSSTAPPTYPNSTTSSTYSSISPPLSTYNTTTPTSTYNSTTSATSSSTYPPTPTCTNTLTDPNNCGTCGNVCSSGTCEAGTCTSSECTAQVCGGFVNCNSNSNCFCFSSTLEAPTNGFCGLNAVCDELTACATDSDCAAGGSTGNICAVNTCCPEPSQDQPGVCLQGQCGNPAKKLMMMARAKGLRKTTAAF